MTPHPLWDLTQLCRGSINLARRARNYVEQLGWESAEDVVKDAVRNERVIAASAHKAEVYTREALRLMDQAQQPDSDGGCMITPAEAKAIRALEKKAAEVDHDISERATIDTQ